MSGLKSSQAAEIAHTYDIEPSENKDKQKFDITIALEYNGIASYVYVNRNFKVSRLREVFQSKMKMLFVYQGQILNEKKTFGSYIQEDQARIVVYADDPEKTIEPKDYDKWADINTEFSDYERVVKLYRDILQNELSRLIDLRRVKSRKIETLKEKKEKYHYNQNETILSIPEGQEEPSVEPLPIFW